MNRIKQLFKSTGGKVLSIYFTAGYPQLDDTIKVLEALQRHGADMIEIGMPYSDPLADGPVIQQSSMQALENGISISKLFDQVREFNEKGLRNEKTSFVLMGYLNPVMQYGFERFLQQAKRLGVDGIILPDLPVADFERLYKRLFEKYELQFIFLVTPETSPERIKKIDKLSQSFIYAVSSSSTTGLDKNIGAQSTYFKRLKNMHLKNPVMVGFGIRDAETFKSATTDTAGAIIGTAYIKAISGADNLEQATSAFLNSILDG